MLAVGVPATAAQTLTVTVPAAETYGRHTIPSPGYAVGDATTAMLVVAPAMLAVPLAHAPSARVDPPILPVVPESGMFDFTKAVVAILVELSDALCVAAWQ